MAGENGTTNDDRLLKAFSTAASAMIAAKKTFAKVTLSNGVVLKFRDIPSGTLKRAMAQVERPPVPVVMIEEKGREEENPNDPRYLLAMNEYNLERLDIYDRLLMSIGVEIVFVPPGMYRVEDDEWIEECRFLGIEPKTDLSLIRKHEWLTLYACRDSEDALKVRNTSFARSGGVMEEEVAEAYNWFRDPAIRRALVGAPGSEGVGDGVDLPPDDPGDGLRDRGEGSGAVSGDAVVAVADDAEGGAGGGGGALPAAHPDEGAPKRRARQGARAAKAKG